MKRAGLTLLVFLGLLVPLSAGAGDIAVRGAVEKQNVYVGEAFTFQIQVEGDDSPAEPDLSGLDDFQVTPRGGQQNSSESVTIVNGKVNRVSRHGYIFNYSLAPKKAGRLTIPAVKVAAAGKEYFTSPIDILVSKPQENEDFKLRLQLSKKRCYVGEPVDLTVTWYIGRNVENFNYTLPYLDDSRFTVADLKENGPVGNQDVVEIPLGRKTIKAVKGKGVLNGREYLTVRFRQSLIPGEAGSFKLPQATVSCKILSGNRQHGFADPFENFFRGNRQSYSTIITPSNQPTLEVLPLPDQGRPADFTGLVGNYSIIATATPQKVNVGDPITLTIMVTGPEYLGNVTLPDLRRNQALTLDFKVPDEMAAGEIQGPKVVFTQTIRARKSSVTRIPPLSIVFFNPETRRYETASSGAIPLTVRQTRIVTAMDAEGRDLGPAKNEIRELRQGIAQNFTGPSLLENQEFYRVETLLPGRWPLYLVLVPFFSSLLWLVTFLAELHRRNPQARRAGKAKAVFMRSLDSIKGKVDEGGPEIYVALIEAIREYLGSRLFLPPGALTFRDVEGPLQNNKVPSEILAALRGIMEKCEAFHYAGPTVAEGMGRSDLQKVEEVIAAIERSFS